MSGEFTDANALSALLTVESLLFAALSLTGALAAPATRVRDLALTPKQLGYVVSGFISVVALGAMMAWSQIFIDDWPCDVRRATIAVVLAIAIVGQPTLAWVLARGFGKKR